MSLDKLENIAEEIRGNLDALTIARDAALTNARTLTRHCAHAIRAVHREEYDKAMEELSEADGLAKSLCENEKIFPNVYFAGYTQDSLKEYAEAKIVYAMVNHVDIPSPDELGMQGPTYLKGLSEAVGEMRRRILDLMRSGHSDEVETLLGYMDDVYAVLVTMDYSDAITYGLRRLTDITRSIIERTRGDITVSYRQQRLENALIQAEERLNSQE